MFRHMIRFVHKNDRYQDTAPIVRSIMQFHQSKCLNENSSAQSVNSSEAPKRIEISKINFDKLNFDDKNIQLITIYEQEVIFS